MIMPATLSILANVFTESRERRRAIAYWSMMKRGGDDHRTHLWRPSAASLLVGLGVPCQRARGHPRPHRRALPGAHVTETRSPRASISWERRCRRAGLSILLVAIISGPERGWLSPATGLTVGFALMVLTLFVVWELHMEHPMLDVRFFKDMRLTAASASITIAMIALTGMMFLVAQLLQFTKGYSPLAAGLRVALPLLVVNFTVMPITPRITERFGPKRTVAGGLLAITGGLVLLSLTGLHTPYPNLLVAFMLMATGFSLFLPASTDAIMGTLPKEHSGSGSAINQTSRQAGQALGIAIGGSIAASGFRSTLDDYAPGGPVPAAVIERAKESIAGSYHIAEELDRAVREPFLRLVDQAFVHGFQLSIKVSAVTAVFGAVVALVFLPRTLPSHELNPSEMLPTDLVVDYDEIDRGA